MTSIRIKDLCKRLSLNTEKRVVKYALEIARRHHRNVEILEVYVSRSLSKRISKTARRQGVVCVDAISVELACQVCKYPLTEEKRKTLIKSRSEPECVSTDVGKDKSEFGH